MGIYVFLFAGNISLEGDRSKCPLPPLSKSIKYHLLMLDKPTKPLSSYPTKSESEKSIAFH